MSEEKEKIDWNKREIGALWKKTKGIQAFYSGKLTIDGKDIEIICFSNKHKTEEKHPDVRIYLSSDPVPTDNSII